MTISKQPISIFAIDDEKPIRDLLQRALSNAGFKVKTFADGREALAAMANDPPALILLDVSMPGISGIDTLTLLKQQYPSIPVFMLTAVFDLDTMTLATEKGAFDYLLKPFDIPVLIEHLQNYAARHIEKAA